MLTLNYRANVVFCNYRLPTVQTKRKKNYIYLNIDGKNGEILMHLFNNAIRYNK